MESVVPKLFGTPGGELFSRPRVWVRINMPAQVTDPEKAIAGILLQTVCASNVECLNETIYFERDGTSIPLTRNPAAKQYLVAPLSVAGEYGGEYTAAESAVKSLTAGRYSIREDRIEIRPAAVGTEREDRYANVRLWMTNGSLGNAVGVGRVHSFLRKEGTLNLRVSNPTGAAGGHDGVSFADARDGFYHALLSRNRLVTREDLDSAVRAFDRRLEDVEVSRDLRRTETGLQRVHCIVVPVRREQFLDYARESRTLADELKRYLMKRSLFDVPIDVQLRERVE